MAQERRQSITEEMLNAYLDGELDEARRTRVEAYLAENPSAAAYVREGEQLSSRLHQLFDRYLSEPLPEDHVELASKLERELRQTQRRTQLKGRCLRLAATAAVFTLFGAAAVVGWQQFGYEPNRESLFAFFERDAGPESRSASTSTSDKNTMAVAEEADALSQGQTQAPTGGEAKGGAPDFSEFGFSLISTRILAKQDSRSMQLTYEADTGARVELFFTHNAHANKSSLTLVEEGPVSILTWNDAGHAYILVGEVERDKLLQMGKRVNSEWTLDEYPADDASSGESGKQGASGGSDDSADPSAGGSNDSSKGTGGTVTPEDTRNAATKPEEDA